MRQLFLKYPYLCIGLLVTVFFIICAWCLPIQFEENDDITMLLLASGKYSGTPEAHLIYINYIWGLFLTIWYFLIPKIEWYTVWFSILHIIGVTVMLKLIIFRKIHSIIKLFLICTILLFEVFFVVNFQFTTTAMLISISGIALILSTDKKKEILFGIACLLIGGIIREESAILVLVISSPILVLYLFRNKTHLFYIIGSIVLMLLFHSFNFLSYNNDRWAEFYKFRVLKATIIDNPNTGRFIASIKNYSKSEDVQLFTSSIFDNKIMNNNELQKISNEVNTKSLLSIFSETLGIFKSLIIGDLNKHLLPIQYLILLVFLLSFSNITNAEKVAFFLIIAIMFLVICYIPIFRTLKFRAFISVLFTVYILLCIYIKLDSKIGILLISILLFQLSSYIVRISRNYNTYNHRKQELFSKQITVIKSYNNKIIPVGNSFLIECYNPFKVSENWETRKMYSFALVGSPLNTGICNNHYEIVNVAAIFVDKNAVESITKRLIESIYTHYHVTAKYKIVAQDSLSAIVQIYR